MQWFFSLRYFLHGPVIDRRPQFVRHSHGEFRIQCLTPLTPESAASQHYLKIIWSAHAEADELTLAARRHQFPVGVSLGVVPQLNPTLYTVGLSYKLHPWMKAVATVGIRKGQGNVFVYGFTIDLQNVLTSAVGSPPKSSSGSSASGK